MPTATAMPTESAVPTESGVHRETMSAEMCEAVSAMLPEHVAIVSMVETSVMMEAANAEIERAIERIIRISRISVVGVGIVGRAVTGCRPACGKEKPDT
jgi:hypothetical protein